MEKQKQPQDKPGQGRPQDRPKRDDQRESNPSKFPQRQTPGPAGRPGEGQERQ